MIEGTESVGDLPEGDEEDLSSFQGHAARFCGKSQSIKRWLARPEDSRSVLGTHTMEREN